MRQEKASCLFGSCRLFPGLPPSQLWCANPFRLCSRRQPQSSAANPSPLPAIRPKLSLSSQPARPGGGADKPLGLAVFTPPTPVLSLRSDRSPSLSSQPRPPRRLSRQASQADGSFRQNRSNLTSLLVQPISASLVAKLISSPKDRITHSACSPLELPNNEERIVSMQIQTVTKFETVTNVVGYLKGSTSPDRYIIVGSRHHTAYSYNGQEWASSTAIITAFIRALMLRVKRGWRPDRTIVFCSWGGTAFGNIGSYEWGEDFKKVLQKNVVAYVSLHSPVSGNSSLYSVASPSLQQLVAEVR
ncbi:hypothetical protein J1605_017177 [Eschrichtius robustus]|uniref:Inactive N-acetylated-alpha-linked acidic dipeptidase-like protein 2 n=1 Tax=Eschrichtius robustus TaxID=9764 RepID=A0AB34I3W9_ESCRO|nr:hypothetical protein J1605_017177 [Eschrichtius robustus]